MWLRNKIIFSILILSIGYNQSVMNSYGIGMLDLKQDVASNGSSSNGFLPSFRKGVAISNPVTWHLLPYSYLSFGYSGNISTIEEPSIQNYGSGLGSFNLIIPMKNKYAFGLSVMPYMNRHYILEGPGTIYSDPVFDDTLTVQQTVSGFGGINAFKSVFSFPISENERLAFSMNFLFGSSRKINTTTLNGIDYILHERNLFKGALAHAYFYSDRMKYDQFNIATYAAFSMTVTPISLEQYIYQPFEDATTSLSDYGVYDNWDFPSPSLTLDPINNLYEKVVSPMDYQLGFDISHPTANYQIGWYHWQDNLEKTAEFSYLDLQLKETNRFHMSVCKFRPINQKNTFEKLNYRFGLFMRNDLIITTGSLENTINEKGASFGIGIQFGSTKNQLDLSYSISVRNGLQFTNELNQSFSIGLSIGDLWFVKRRQR